MPYNTNDPAQRLALANEITLDPNGYGFAAEIATGNDTLIAEKLNLVRSAIIVRRGVRTAIEVMNCITLAAWEALVVARQQYLIALVTPVEGVDLSHDTIRANLNTCFPVGPTRTALLAAADRPGSRAEQLFGTDSRITPTDVAQALRP